MSFELIAGEDDGLTARGSARRRILDAALATFHERGYAQTSTLEIVTRAKVSKRELYALFGNKQAVLVACMADWVAAHMRPPDVPAPRDRATLASMLTMYGGVLLREVSHPMVVETFRLAIAEAERSPEVGRTLHAAARQANRAALAQRLELAQSAGLLGQGDPAGMARLFMALLWEDLMVDMLLGCAAIPSAAAVDRQAQKATALFLELHPEPVPPG